MKATFQKFCISHQASWLDCLKEHPTVVPSSLLISLSNVSKSHYLELSYRQSFTRKNSRNLNFFNPTQWFQPFLEQPQQKDSHVLLMVGTLPHPARKCTKAETESDGHILFTNIPGKVVLESQNLITICFYHSVNQYTPFTPARIK